MNHQQLESERYLGKDFHRQIAALERREKRKKQADGIIAWGFFSVGILSILYSVQLILSS